MVLGELVRRAVVWTFPVLRWSVLRGLGGLGLLLPDVLWEFQEPDRTREESITEI